MRHRKPRRFRHRMNDRGHSMINNSIDQVGLGNNSFNNGRGRNNFKPHQSAEKLVEKYMDRCSGNKYMLQYFHPLYQYQ